MPNRLGILAGGGDVPRCVIEACLAEHRTVFVVAFIGHTDPKTVSGVPHMWARLGAAGTVLRRLKAENIDEITLIGHIRRPSLAELRPDWWAARLFARIGLRSLGDDGLLRAVTGELEREGLRIVGADDVCRDLLTPVGVLGRIKPDAQAREDIARGIEVADALGALDVGQAVVVHPGLVLGVEAIEGTDALLDRCAVLHRRGPGGVLIKMCKPNQDRRLDLPTIGVATVEHAARSGVRGIALGAGETLIVEQASVIDTADALGVFVIGVNKGEWAS